MQRSSLPSRGFTLVELVVVVAIIALLAGILIPVVTSQIDDAKRTRALADMDTVAKAFTTFRTHTSMWPGSSQAVALSAMVTGNEELVLYRSLYSNTQTLPGWKGPYLNEGAMVGNNMQAAIAATNNAPARGMIDPWGRPYRVYVTAQSSGNTGSIALLCRGPNGTVESSAADVRAGAPAGDDILKVISRRL